jgi:hypothetical protein
MAVFTVVGTTRVSPASPMRAVRGDPPGATLRLVAPGAGSRDDEVIVYARLLGRG